MARFAVVGNTLYTVSHRDLSAYDISNPASPAFMSTTQVGTDVETIYPYGGNLFIGSQTGMFIYDASNPGQPSYRGRYEHVFSCDPVVVNGNYAYVTLSTNVRQGRCVRGVNELQLIDISNPSHPSQVMTYPMTNPQGMGVDGNLLFVCDQGLKVYDATNPMGLNLLHHFQDVLATDVIPLGSRLLVIGDGGFYQYAYDNNSVTLLSTIPVE